MTYAPKVRHPIGELDFILDILIFLAIKASLAVQVPFSGSIQTTPCAETRYLLFIPGGHGGRPETGQ
jgi:hypothetical protein